MVRLQNTALVLFLAFFTLIAGTVPLYFDATLRFVSHLILLAIVAGWLVLLLRGRRDFPRTPIDLPLWLFLGAMALSTAFSTNRRLSLELLAVNLLYGLLFYVWVDLLRRARAEARVVTATLLVAAVVTGLGVAEVVGWYLGLFPSLGFEQGWPQIGGLHLVPPVLRRTWLVMSVPNTLGAYLVLVIPLGIAVVRMASSRGKRLLVGTWVALSIVVLFFTFSRGAWLGLAASLPVLGLPLYRLGAVRALRAVAVRRRRELVGALLFGMVVVAFMAHPTAQLLVGRGSEAARLILYRNALDMASERPLLGYGLGTFGQVNLERVSGTTLQTAVHGHAHNAYLNNLAEMGIVGTVALLWLLLALARVAWTAIRRAGDGGSSTLATAAAAGLVGSAVQDLFETPLDQPALLFTTMILVAILLEIQRRWAPAPQETAMVSPGSAGILPARACAAILRVMRNRTGWGETLFSWDRGRPRPHRGCCGRGRPRSQDGHVPWVSRGQDARAPRGDRILAPAALAGVAVIAAVLLYIGWANLVYAQGLAAAARSDWGRAEERIARAAGMDPDLTYYRFALANVEAQAAMARDDQGGLDRAAGDFAAALAVDGSYAQNYVNLAMVYQRSGRPDAAIAAMQDALKLDGANALYELNLGYLYEQTGQQDAAIAAYSRAIRNDLSLLRQSFWRASPERRALWPLIIQRVEADLSPTFVTAAAQTVRLSDAETTISVARALELSAQGQPDQALSILDALIARQPEYGRLWLERGHVHLTSGSLEAAEHDLRVALFIDPSPLTHYYLGELARIRGDRQGALEHFSRLAVARTVPTGYATLVYRRDGILEPYIPGFIQFTLNDDLIEPALRVARFQETIGAPERAAEIYARLLEYDPELRDAREGLARTHGQAVHSY